MCELLGMSANVPTDICFSFTGLMQRGGGTGPHRDGWGIAFYEGKGCRTFHDPGPSVNSEIARLVQRHPIKSHIVISHIRQANVGQVCLENTHPFSRELWGRHWTYAHNGQLTAEVFSWPVDIYQPVGTTDSEQAFCWLLGQIRQQFPQPPADEIQQQRLNDLIRRCCDQLRGLGVFNMMLSDAERLYVYCTTKLHWITRRAPFGQAVLSDADLSVDFGTETTPNDVVTMIATMPLTTNEVWQPLHVGELLVFRLGLIEAHLGREE
ncbi:class II glutamine amidotransferase [Pokkaliibacter sp. MBI-7]|uniref:class II glutamine amidotransferase n=1 Tax=Pokkaliibacter sp. MBI-7 TaxID=3040600 RepID=UPI00244A5611|nr:class II glutamine amidotransferase [Pokkaliibacter sp. MBI-7]MDH2435024.1 class II glutamine amidotransferase [Pokkaliibacter sp. MBI-7]